MSKTEIDVCYNNIMKEFEQKHRENMWRILKNKLPFGDRNEIIPHNISIFIDMTCPGTNLKPSEVFKGHKQVVFGFLGTRYLIHLMDPSKYVSFVVMKNKGGRGSFTLGKDHQAESTF
jgi:hypothetical protein